MVITVLYTKNLEPITAINIPIDVQEQIQQKGLGKLPVLPNKDAKESEAKYLYIHPVSVLGFHKQVHVFFTTQEEELALAITPEWLPGQRPMVQHMQKIIYEQQKTLRKLSGGNNPAV